MIIIRKLFKIYKDCKIKDPSYRLSANYVLWILFIKFLTFIPAYLLNRIKVSPDSITFLSFIFVPVGSYLIINQNTLMGSTCWLIFGFLDALDGDMARLSKRKTFYGEMLDSFGADIFYFITPTTIGYYLFLNQSQLSINYNPNNLLIIGFLITFFLIFTRYMGSKRYILRLISQSKNSEFYKKKKIDKFKRIKSNTSFLENVIIRKNFFAEPGMILNYFILFYLENLKYLELYLIIMFVYFFIIFIKRTLASIIYFSNI